jgi:hypothetical protein
MLTTDLVSFLVAGCCLLVATYLPTEATPVTSTVAADSNSGTHSPTETDREKYNVLRAAILERYPRERLIQEFVLNSHCPFQVLTVHNITRIMCDIPQIRNCNSDRDYCKDISDSCHQAYINTYVVPSARKTERVEIGCIYHPRAIGIPAKARDVLSEGIIQ